MRFTYVDQTQMGIYMDLPICKKSISFISRNLNPEGASWRLMCVDIKMWEYMRIFDQQHLYWIWIFFCDLTRWLR